MNESECLNRMVAPGTKRPGKYRDGVIQIHITRACDQACCNCTQGSQFGGKTAFMTPGQFSDALRSLDGWWGVVGVFGGNPATSPHFAEYCSLLRDAFPKEQRGLWCNNLRTIENARAARETFDPAVSNLNVHLDSRAYALFREGWPEARPFGLTEDVRHSPPLAAMRDLVPDESQRWALISDCDINKHWSAMVGVFRGELRAWFCEIAGAQSILHQDDPSYPDTGLDPTREHDFRGYDVLEDEPMTDPGDVTIDCNHPYVKWWQLGMVAFRRQVRKHCHECGVPLRGRGELAATGNEETVTATHLGVAKPKRAGRPVVLAQELHQLGSLRGRFTDYVQNARV